MNTYVIIGLVVALAGATFGVYETGVSAGKNACMSDKARDERVATIAADAALAKTGDLLSKIEVRNVQQKTIIQRETREVPVYRDCVHTPTGLLGVNAALTGSDAAGAGELPASSAAR